MSANDSNEYNVPTPPTSTNAARLELSLPAATHATQTEWKKVLVILGYLAAIDMLEYLRWWGAPVITLFLVSLSVLGPIWHSQIASVFSNLVTEINKATTNYFSPHNLSSLPASTEEAAGIKCSSPAAVRTKGTTWKNGVWILLLSIGWIVGLILLDPSFRCRLKRSWITVFRFAAYCNVLELSFLPMTDWSMKRSESWKRALRIWFGWFVLDTVVVVLEYFVLCMVVGMEDAGICFVR